MFAGKKIIAVILARGGSKGIPNKNIVTCAGKPLIAWTLEAVQKSKFLDRTIVSTDSKKIKDVVISFDGEAPFERPTEISQDTSGVDEGLRHALKWIQMNDPIQYDYIVYLQATSPLRSSDIIDDAIEFFFSQMTSDEDSMVSVYELSRKYNVIMDYTTGHYVDFVFDISGMKHRRQDGNKLLMPNGAFYIAPIKSFTGTFFHKSTFCYIMPKEISVDIDDVDDLNRVEKILMGKS